MLSITARGIMSDAIDTGDVTYTIGTTTIIGNFAGIIDTGGSIGSDALDALGSIGSVGIIAEGIIGVISVGIDKKFWRAFNIRRFYF